MSSKGILTGGRALTKLIQQDSALGTLIQKIINGVNSVATNTATSAVGKIPPPPSPNSINVTTPGGFMQVTVNHSSEIQKGIQYITHVGTDPDFVNPPIVVDHGSSRSPAPFALPIVDHTGTAINYYVRTLAQYQGSDASTPTIFGVGAPTPITLNGATNTLQPGTGSGTGSTSGQQSLVGLGKVQRTSSGTNPSGGVQTGGGIPAPPTPSGTAGGDLSGSYPNPQVASTHLTAPLPVNQGGSGTTTPSLIGAGTVTITGSWPDQTVTGAAGGITQLTGDVTAGPGSGSQAATLANTAVTPGSYTATNLTVDAKGRITTAASGTAGGGLFSPITVPTTSSTGLTSTYGGTGSGFAIANTTYGISLTENSIASNGNIGGAVKAYPGVPYTATALMSIPLGNASFPTIGLVIADTLTTKALVFHIQVQAAAVLAGVQSWNTPTTFNATVVADTAVAPGGYVWLRVKDDGTNIFFSLSSDDQYFFQEYTVAKSSSFLGSGGFNFMGVMINGQQAAVGTTVMNWIFTTP